MSTSIFDSVQFTERLFFPRDDTSPTPPGATDRFVGDVHVRIHAGPEKTLLLFHGNGEVVADYDDAAERFADLGVRLAVADYRGYGASRGSPTLRGVIADARPIAEVVKPHIVMGRSLGGMAAHELYARPIDGMVGIVLESTLYDLVGLAARRGILIGPTALTDEDRATFEPAGKLAAGRLPLLVLHGARDTLIEPSEAHAAIAAAGSPDKRLALVPNRGHNDISFGESYWSELGAFATRVLR